MPYGEPRLQVGTSPARTYAPSAVSPARITPMLRFTKTRTTGPAVPSASSRQNEGSPGPLEEILVPSILPPSNILRTGRLVGATAQLFPGTPRPRLLVSRFTFYVLFNHIRVA